MIYDEFSLISHYFNNLKSSHLEIESGIGDDCALINVPKNLTLAISTDTLVCGRHFLPDIDPSDLAYKSIAVNISDLAAMGAKPAWLTLSITLPKIEEIWLKKFSDSLFEQLNYYNVPLIGGDTTAGPLSITITIHGYVTPGQALKRTGATLGNWIYVTGTLGDSAAGLAILQKQLTVMDTNDAAWLVKRHLRPTPRIFHGDILRNCATSAIDLSDGLISDLGHILKASGVGAWIDLDLCPLSPQMCKHVETEQALCWAISGGEDYELCFTVPELHRNKLETALSYFGVKLTCIGQIISKSEGLKFIRNGIPFPINWKRYDHFL